MESHFNTIVSELTLLGRSFPVAKLNTKILVRMPKDDWFMKVTSLKERDLSTFPIKDVFASLQAREFDLARIKA